MTQDIYKYSKPQNDSKSQKNSRLLLNRILFRLYVNYEKVTLLTSKFLGLKIFLKAPKNQKHSKSKNDSKLF